MESFSGEHRFVLDYLFREVFDRQPAEIQEFLLKTSVVDRMNAKLCDVITQGEDGQRQLELLERANLFLIPLDERRGWYRYHRLFLDLLRRRLTAEHAGEIPTLHSRASAGFEAEGLVEEAIDHALAAGDDDRAVDLVDKHADAIAERGDSQLLMTWLAELPSELIPTRPRLGVYLGWGHLLRGKLDDADSNLAAVEAANAGIGEAWVVGRVAAVRALLAASRADIAGIGLNADIALENLPKDERAWRTMVLTAKGDALGMQGNIIGAYDARVEALEASESTGNRYLSLLCAMKLAITLRTLGRLPEVVAMCRRYWDVVEAGGLTHMATAGWLLAVWGETAAELMDLDAARDLASRGYRITMGSDSLPLAAWSAGCLTRVEYLRGDLDAAMGVITDFRAEVRDRRIPPYIDASLGMWQLRILLTQAQRGPLEQWERARELGLDDPIVQLNESIYRMYARWLITSERPEEAVALLSRLSDIAHKGSWVSVEIEALTLKAMALDDAGRKAEAVDCLGAALTLAEPGGFMANFVGEGVQLHRLLADAAHHTPDYVAKLLEAAAPGPGAAPSSPLMEDLTEREVEIVQLLATGLRRGDIAERLFVSPHTIKSHIRNIFGKLDVHTQVQAINKARTLGILR